MTQGRNAFRKYGEHFDREDPDKQTGPEPEPESPYEAVRYEPPEKRKKTPADEEAEYLDDLRNS